MRYSKKERLCIDQIMRDPIVTYPPCYRLSPAMMRNEMLHESIRALHMQDFEHYRHPAAHAEIFAAFRSGLFPIYKAHYVVGLFGEKMMYLQMHGWKSMPVTEAVFALENWLI